MIYNCERCGVELSSPGRDAGQRDVCPTCGHTFTVPNVSKTERCNGWLIAMLLGFLIVVLGVWVRSCRQRAILDTYPPPPPRRPMENSQPIRSSPNPGSTAVGVDKQIMNLVLKGVALP